MAVDSANKRFSMMNLGTQPVFPLFPPGTSGVAANERYHLLTLYSGISLLAAPVFSGTIPDISETESTGTHSYDLSTYFTGATSYSISPSVEAGWTFNTSTAELVIDTDDVNSFGPYTITGTNAGGTDDSNAFGVEITVAAVVDPNEAQREPVSGGTSSSWPTRQDYKDKKQRGILEDDEDFMRIVQEALPEILKYLGR